MAKHEAEGSSITYSKTNLAPTRLCRLH